MFDQIVKSPTDGYAKIVTYKALMGNFALKHYI